MASPRSVLANIRGSSKEAARVYEDNASSMRSAARLLLPDEVAGDYDAGRLLSTTLGGYLHAITPEDLAIFKKNAETLGRQYRGGITAKSVVDRSLKDDIDRANRQIKYAVPHRMAKGIVHVVTNAAPSSPDARHHVLVELLNYPAAVSSPASASELAKQLTTGPLRLACDCGRWKFWYSYIATIGKFNASTPQLGFPKIRNPQLRGIACKHLLRVMQTIQTPIFREQIARMIDSAREGTDRKPKVLTKKQAEEIVQQQQAQAAWKRTTIETTTEKRQRLAQQRAVAAVVARQKAAATQQKLTPRQVESAKRQFEVQARKLAGMGLLTAKQLDTMLAKLRGGT